MIKRIIYATIVISLLFIVAFNLHNYINTSILSFSLLNVYSFHAIAAIIVCIVVELVASKLPNQAGYAYLMLIFFKIGAFVLLFQTSVFSKVDLTQSDRVGLVAPLFVFLLAEAFIVYKTLNISN
ncbi:hypothetical protein A8C32_18975 [Flavivirga aquatica]|uniref:Uncharacterized protein n=1 Tax=Flavivirga aquatica TaxID=1849968 RepID=A0A1E5T405_9FLAO|nr:DUF6168 family protein [Flavivirga aquatica]OEK06115.1 hypothetical protein A8C32_18975 [Flavivirga aquatica]